LVCFSSLASTLEAIFTRDGGERRKILELQLHPVAELHSWSFASSVILPKAVTKLNYSIEDERLNINLRSDETQFEWNSYILV
jgi:hypothetical protein